MKTFLLLISLLLTSNSLFAVEKIWTGAVGTDWAADGNWNPAGAPGANDDIVINVTPNMPSISAGTITVQGIILHSTLTVSSGAVLNISGVNRSIALDMDGGLNNNGTVSIGSTGYTGTGCYLVGTSSIFNSGQLILNSGNFGFLFYPGSNAQIVNNASGTITVNSQYNFRYVGNLSSQIINNGIINCSGPLWAIEISTTHTGTAFINTGTINIDNLQGMYNGSVIENRACGIIKLNNGNYENYGSTTNAGLILITNNLLNNGTFINNRVMRYGSLSGTGSFTNPLNNSIVVNNTTPIFTYGGNFMGGINIYKEESLDNLAGDFDAPDDFTPDDLAVGTHTLYARITPPGTNNCPYTVPFSYTVSPLPVTLVSFTVTPEGRSANLAWNTTTETNSSHFDVQHSMDAKTWQNIGKVMSKGESTALETYRYAHTSMQPGGNYYRLKMVDLDGSFAYSRVVSAKSDDASLTASGFYPNPARGSATIDLQVYRTGSWTITSTDIIGRVIYRDVRTLSAGLNKVTILQKGSGLRIVKLTDGVETILRKLVNE